MIGSSIVVKKGEWIPGKDPYIWYYDLPGGEGSRVIYKHAPKEYWVPSGESFKTVTEAKDAVEKQWEEYVLSLIDVVPAVLQEELIF